MELQLKISNKSGLGLNVLRKLSIADHDKSIKDDIAQLRQSMIVPNELVVSGHLYNVQSGHIKKIVSPAPLKIGESK